MGAGPMDVEMGRNNMGHNPGNPEETQDPVLPSTSNQQPGPTASNTGTLALAVEAWALAIAMVQIQEASTASDPTGTDDEKVRLDTYKGVMQGLHAATRTLSAGYTKACIEVQGLVEQSLEKITSKDHDFVVGASTALRQWIKAVQLAIDCLGKSVAEQSHLL